MVTGAPAAFTDEEVERYARHLVLREIGGPGQQRLRAASVLIVGMGGVGCPAAAYLGAAGVGRLGLLDFDVVSLSNLQRQVLFGTADLGRTKVEVAAERLGALNPHVRLDHLPVRLDEANVDALVADYDLVLDGCDSFPTRFAVNAACVRAGRPLVSAALGRWEGLVGVFRGRPCWRCFTPEGPPDAETCAAVGVMGALAGVVGARAALAAIRVIADAGGPPWGRVSYVDALNDRDRSFSVAADPACPACGGG